MLLFYDPLCLSLLQDVDLQGETELCPCTLQPHWFYVLTEPQTLRETPVPMLMITLIITVCV